MAGVRPASMKTKGRDCILSVSREKEKQTNKTNWNKVFSTSETKVEMEIDLDANHQVETANAADLQHLSIGHSGGVVMIWAWTRDKSFVLVIWFSRFFYFFTHKQKSRYIFADIITQTGCKAFRFNNLQLLLIWNSRLDHPPCAAARLFNSTVNESGFRSLQERRSSVQNTFEEE